MIEERLHRLHDFRAGRELQLADRQWWTFPAPPADGDETALGGRSEEYSGLLAAIRESEDMRALLLAELALAMFLFELNYRVQAEELRDLFTFPPGSPELADSQRGFRALARDHLPLVYGAEPPPAADPRLGPKLPPVWIRLASRLRALRPLRGWPLNGRQGQALP